ncbi:hypothetical protein CRI94_12200 [Longibacter salinarum]|uniref:Uncharacterized protein n=1 Tax=Longibacter salinarum TaxID=1850348 RepID=A0A2A8CW07_9BACT|nr:hypothetical protein CRI94_12200 [Longibacter salinarum]
MEASEVGSGRAGQRRDYVSREVPWMYGSGPFEFAARAGERGKGEKGGKGRKGERGERGKGEKGGKGEGENGRRTSWSIGPAGYRV